MTAPHAPALDFAALARPSAIGSRLALRLVALLAVYGIPAREGLPGLALRRATADGTPADHLAPGVYVHATGDVAVIVWHARAGAGEPLLEGLAEALAAEGTTGPLAETIDAPPSFRPWFQVTWPDATDAPAVLVEEIGEVAP